MRSSTFNTPLKNVRGLGTAGGGAQHWWLQRVTAVALAPLAFAFAVLIIRLTGAEFGAARALVGNPVVAGVLILTFIVAFWHLKLGAQVVIEDYIHGPAARLILLLASLFGCWIGGLVAVLAVLRIALGG